ncbi:MAG: hypothetical protein JNL67_23235 [Planctomycetaceae bacterium]|nr:hypothetical protein [Planctomycetaceae bacterium]
MPTLQVLDPRIVSQTLARPSHQNQPDGQNDGTEFHRYSSEVVRPRRPNDLTCLRSTLLATVEKLNQTLQIGNVGTGNWELGNAEWGMGNGKWGVGNGKW